MLSLKKLCVGIKSFDELEMYQSNLIKNNQIISISTRMWPKRFKEILLGGSLYWVIKNKFSARQLILGFEEIFREDGKRFCKILLDRKLHRVVNYPQRPFQGWRYLTDEKKPKDIFTDEDNKEIPPELLAELNEFGIT